MRVWICGLLPLLCHCYLSSEVGEGARLRGDADVESQDGVTADGSGADGSGADGAGADGEQVHQPLRRTFLVMHDWVIEERRLDNPLEIVDSQEMPERLANIFSDNVHGQVRQLAATEHGFLFRYDKGLSRNIYVYDRRRGWSIHPEPGDSLFVESQAIIRNGWLYPAAQDPAAGHRESAEYAFHIESGRFVEVAPPPLFFSMFDGLDGRIVTTTTPARAWAIEPGDAGSTGAVRPLHDDGDSFPAFPWIGELGTQASGFRDGSIPVFIGADDSLPPPDNGRTWALVRQDPTNYIFRIEKRVQRNESTGNIVTTPDDTVLYYRRSRRRGSWENQNHEVTLFRMDANLENEEALLTERWYFPVEIALGDPVERVVAARD